MENEIYSRINSSLFSSINTHSKQFMLNIYHIEYNNICNLYGFDRISTLDEFINKLDQNEIRMFQQHCLNCGSIEVVLLMNESNEPKYCTMCGRKSLGEFGVENIDRVTRIISFHSFTVNNLHNTLIDLNDDTEKFLAYDTAQIELIVINSVLETVVKEYYEQLMKLKLLNISDSTIIKFINESYKNDFQNIERTIYIFRKYLNIDLRQNITSDDFRKLHEIVELRNVFIHNNGIADKRFLDSTKNKDLIRNLNSDKKIIGDKYIFLDRKDILSYVEAIINLFSSLDQTFESFFMENIHSVFIMYYLKKIK